MLAGIIGQEGIRIHSVSEKEYKYVSKKGMIRSFVTNGVDEWKKPFSRIRLRSRVRAIRLTMNDRLARHAVMMQKRCQILV